MIRILSVLLCSLAVPAAAQIEAPQDALARIEAEVPEPTLDRWRARPGDVIDQVIEIAFGFGPGNAATPEAIETTILEGRAQARARAIRDVLAADLDGDLVVTRAEIDAVDLARSGYARGLLWTRFRHADTDRSGDVSFEELRSYADVRALDFLSQGRASDMRALIALDLDQDGAVTVEEAEAALAALTRMGPKATGARAEKDA